MLHGYLNSGSGIGVCIGILVGRGLSSKVLWATVPYQRHRFNAEFTHMYISSYDHGLPPPLTKTEDGNGFPIDFRFQLGNRFRLQFSLRGGEAHDRSRYII